MLKKPLATLHYSTYKLNLWLAINIIDFSEKSNGAIIGP